MWLPKRNSFGGVSRVADTAVVAEKVGVRAPMQFVWVLPAGVDEDSVAGVGRALSQGVLGARWCAARVPFARPSWVTPAASLPPTVVERCVIEVGGQQRWADVQMQASLELGCGASGWQLAAARVANGGAVVSLVASHALTDGMGLVAGVDAAARGISDARQRRRPGVGGDVCDAFGAGARAHALRVAAIVTRFGEERSVRGAVGNAARFALLGNPVEHRQPPHSSSVSVNAADLAAVAVRHGGTPTGLATAVVANVAREVKHIDSARGVTVAIPVSRRRSANATTDNALGTAYLSLPEQPQRYTDLVDLRRRAKSAYAYASDNLTRSVSVDCMLSSIGTLPATFVNAFGPADSVIPRAAVLRIPSASPLATRSHPLRVYTAATADATTFTFVHADTDLEAIVATEISSWGLTPTSAWNVL